MEHIGMQTSERRCLALWFPFLPCERAQSAARADPAEDAAPFALVDRIGNALRLTAVDRRAARQGLVAGMTLADARARCPELVTQQANPAADALHLGQVLERMRQFTPMVALDPPGGLILDISGCAHLFGGEEALAVQARRSAGHASRHAFGPNAMAARALVRHACTAEDRREERVAALPVAALELEDSALAALRRAGLRTIGDLASRSMGMIAARFGEQAVTRLRQIMGEAASPVAPSRPVAPIRAEARFPEPIARTDDVMDVIEELLEQVARQMEARKLGGRRFAIRLWRSDGARQGLAIETGQPVRDPAAVLRLLRERIDRMADPLDPGFGFDSVLLAVPHVEPLAERQQAMEEEGAATGDQDVMTLVDRLSIRLGSGNVTRLQPCDRHLPELSQRQVPATQARATAWPAQDRPPRPLLMFDPPQPVAVIAGVPDGPPLRFRWRDRLHEVTLAEGPERIGAEWWRRRQGHQPGGAGRTRDYYRIEDKEGRRYWMFRHGLFGEQGEIAWYLHGLFP